MAYENDVLTRNEDSELAVRVVTATEGTNNSSYDDVFTRDSNGKLAVRVVGAGGGDSHNLGFYATQAALEEAYPTAEEGDYAIVGSTDTVWVWDTDNSEWVDTGTKGLVQSVNGQTGTVVLRAADVGALPISGGTVSGPVTLSDTASETKTMLTVGCGPDSSKYFKVVPSHQWSQVDMGIGNSLSLTITGGGLMPNVDNPNVDLGSQFYPFKNVYAELVETGVIKNGGRITVPQYILGTMAVQVSTVPAAHESYVGQIYQYIGATDANYTNGYFYKCVSDGGNPATYSWTEVSVGGGNVNSVNNQTGNVVLDAEDVGAIPQLSTMPTASATNVGNIVQFKGTTTETYTNGYFYKSTATGSEIVSGTATVTEYINGEGNTPSVTPTFIFDKSVFDAYLVSQSEPENTGTTVTFSWEADDETGDTYLVATYNTNDRVLTPLTSEIGPVLNQDYAVLGFTTNFLIEEDREPTEEEWDIMYQQHLGSLGHITVSLPTENTYGWERIDVQPTPSGLPSQTGHSGEFLTTNGTSASWSTVQSLPSQTGNSGKFLTTDGTDASWATINALTNATSSNGSISIGGGSYWSMAGTNVGISSQINGSDGTAIGYLSKAGFSGTAVGSMANAAANRSIQLGRDGTNNDANTFKVANQNGNFEIMSADGTIPTDRYTTTPSADGTYVPTLTISSGVATRSWAAPGGGGGSTSTTATLTTVGWSNNSQTVNVTGVTAGNNVIVSAAPASQSDYTSAGVFCSAQGAGTLTFTCTTTPTNAITVNVVIFG